MSRTVFMGGLPFAPDVNRLDAAFPVGELIEGRLIEHEGIEAIVQAKRGTGRYYGVVNAWISRQRNTNGIFITWQPGDGVKILSPAEVLEHTETRARQKMRQTGKAIKNFAWVDRNRLDEMGQKRLDHQMRVAGAIKDALDKGRRELAIDLAPVISLPKRKIG